MPKNICLDLNVILDFLLKRPGGQSIKQIIYRSQSGTFKLCVSAHCVTTLYYLLRREGRSVREIRVTVEWLLSIADILSTDKAILKRSLSTLQDYEDAVVEQAAYRTGCDYIVTRNIKDFAGSKVQAVTPEAFLASL